MLRMGLMSTMASSMSRHQRPGVAFFTGGVKHQLEQCLVCAAGLGTDTPHYCPRRIVISYRTVEGDFGGVCITGKQ